MTKDPSLRETIKEEHPEWQLTSGKWSQPDFMAEYARRWKTMTTEEKAPYVEQARVAKENFVPSQPSSTEQVSRSEEPQQKPKKAMSSWMFFLHDPTIRDPIKKELYLEKIKELKETSEMSEEEYESLSKLDESELSEKGIKIKPTEITKRASLQWKTLSEEERQPWIEKHETEKKDLADNPIMVTSKKKKSRASPPQTIPSRSSEESSELHQLREQVAKQNEQLQLLSKIVEQLSARLPATSN